MYCCREIVVVVVWVMGSQLLVRSFSRQGYSFFLRHVDEVSYGYRMHVFIHFPEDFHMMCSKKDIFR